MLGPALVFVGFAENIFKIHKSNPHQKVADQQKLDFLEEKHGNDASEAFFGFLPLQQLLLLVAVAAAVSGKVEQVTEFV